MKISQAMNIKFLFTARAFALLVGVGIFAFSVAGQKTAPQANPNLDQCGNGSQAAPVACTGNNWQNGNLNSNNSHYIEGQSVPYRAAFAGTIGNSSSITIEYDTTKAGKHALDYLTSFDRTETLGMGNDPCSGVAGCSLGTFTTFPIPIDPDVTAGFDHIPANGDDITQIPGNFTLFGGTITGVSSYGFSGSYAGDSTRFITVTFTLNSANVVLAWSGHTGTRLDWGLNNSAIAISGAPYHLAIGGSNASMSVEALIVPGSVKIVKLVNNLDGSFYNTVNSFGFVSSSNFGTTSFSLMDTDPLPFAGGSTTNSSVIAFGAANTITVREPVPLNGYSALTYVCVEDPGGLPQLDNSTTSIDIVNGATATIIVEEGELITCTLTNTQVTPSAANVTVSGRVSTEGGRGISNARVTLTDSNGGTRTAITGTFGYYRFDEVESGQTYVISVISKRYQFSPRVISVTDEIAGLDFTAFE